MLALTSTLADIKRDIQLAEDYEAVINRLLEIDWENLTHKQAQAKITSMIKMANKARGKRVGM